MMSEDENIQTIRALVRNALSKRRDVLVYETAHQLADLFQSSALVHETESGEFNDWTRIESLSRLRALVGGRFQNLKERWVAAGFPLREHRGDRSGKKNLDREGWLELSAWIYKQGFEIRLAQEQDPWLFEIRKLVEN